MLLPAIEVAYNPLGIPYPIRSTLSMISRTELSDDAIDDTPIQLHRKLTIDMGEPLVNPTQYHELIGALFYFTISQPGIGYIIHIVGQFVDPSTSTHYTALLHIFKCLISTITRLLFFPSSSSLKL